MVINYTERILGYLEQMQYEVLYLDEESGIVKVANQKDGVYHLIIGIVPPVLIFEYYIMNITNESLDMYKQLLQKNRDMIHGAFVLNETGKQLLYRYTLQIENVDFNEFESAVNALSFLLNEYAHQLINFSKQIKP